MYAAVLRFGCSGGGRCHGDGGVVVWGNFGFFGFFGFYLVFLIVLGSRLWVSLGFLGFPCVFGLLGISVGL